MESNKFTYTYSASENKEIREIRKKYLPPEENKLQELRRLDQTVRVAGSTEALIAGIAGGLVFGVGLCLGLGVLPGGLLPAISLCLLGTAAMIAAYPLRCRIAAKTKAKYAPRILQLADEISEQK
ncbi:MAG: hypothetical protein IJW44_04030 [Clostridia bacterium]|nr:hypothetical protein [Clostridia bacterium]